MTVQALPRAERRPRVLLVMSHDVMRLGLRSLLEAGRRLEVVADVPTVAEASQAAAEHRPALVVIAGPLGDGSALEGCRRVVSDIRDARVVILGDAVDETSTLAATRAGAIGYLSRRAGAEQLCRALRLLAAGERPSPAPPAPIPRARGGGGARDVLALTAQERRVLRLVADGKTNKEIARELGLSAKTVKNYLSHAFEKLNVSRRAQAAVLFIKEHGPALIRGGHV